MRVLILGGSWSLGRLIADGCAQRGLDVTIFNRGRGTASLIDGVQVVHGDRKADEDLRDLARLGHWDAVVDIGGKVPAVVRRSARVLADVAERYVSVSTNLVYRDWPHAPVDEDSPTYGGDPDFDPGEWTWDPKLYGRMKAGCEAAGREAFGDERVLILRLHEIIGQHEDDGPLLWWLNRMRRGGEVLVPAPDRPIQPIDVRDVGLFTIDLVVERVTGVINVAAPHEGRTFDTMVRACAEVVAADAVAASELVWIDEDWLMERGVQQWTELPLWRNAPAPWDMDVERALALGLRCRPLIDTAAATWRWLTTGNPRIDHQRFTAYGIDPAREASLIAEWRGR
jgi:nucleoside-diphosphate-sugar epimerase